MTFGRTTGWSSVLLVAAAAFAAAPSVGEAEQVVAIRMRGHYLLAPATLRVTIAVEPHAANRELRVQADGDTFFRSSTVTLDGDSDKRLHILEFRNLPEGSYQVRAEVLSNNSVRGQATERITVVPGGAVR